MTAPPLGKGALHARYPLPHWVVDSKAKHGLTLAIADAIAAAIEHLPRFQGPTAHWDYAEHVTRAVREVLEPWLDWLADNLTDGVSYPGDVLVSYISQLALTRPGETLDPDHYRELLRAYSRYLVQQARRFDAAPPDRPARPRPIGPVREPP
jgi:hypothetical protein